MWMSLLLPAPSSTPPNCPCRWPGLLHEHVMIIFPNLTLWTPAATESKSREEILCKAPPTSKKIYFTVSALNCSVNTVHVVSAAKAHLTQCVQVCQHRLEGSRRRMQRESTWSVFKVTAADSRGRFFCRCPLHSGVLQQVMHTELSLPVQNCW